MPDRPAAKTDTIDAGWHSRGYLPHFDAPEVVQSVIFRLVDSLPHHVIEIRADTPIPGASLDAELDGGAGRCWLRRNDLALLVESALLHFDGERYSLLAWCIMPNHVHVMLEMRPDHRLGDQVRSWKGYTARRANERLGRAGAFWSPDYFDRYIRDQNHYAHALNYIEYNPVKAGLAASPELWPWSSARYR